MRATRQRLAVLQALAAEPNDATAQEIYARLADGGEPVGLATVYRTLALLNDTGSSMPWRTALGSSVTASR